jgi:hypothetical protein
MAGTDLDSIPEWSLLIEVRAFVAGYTKSLPAAEELVLDYAQRGHFKRYRFQSPKEPPLPAYVIKAMREGKQTVERPEGIAAAEWGEERGIRPESWGISDHGVSITVDWDNSCVTYRFMEADLSDEMLHHIELARGRGLFPKPYFRITLVRLHRDDVFAMLQAADLMPRLPASPCSSPSKPTPMPFNERQDEAVSASESRFPTLAMLGLKGWQQEIVWMVASELYSKGISEELRAVDLWRKVEKHPAAKAKATEKGRKLPSQDTCEKFLIKYRAWCAKQRKN